MEYFETIRTDEICQINYLTNGTIGYLKRGDKIHKCRVVGHEFRKDEYGRGILRNKWQVAGCDKIILDADYQGYNVNELYMPVMPTIQAAKEKSLLGNMPSLLDIKGYFKGDDGLAYFDLRACLEKKYGCSKQIHSDGITAKYLYMYKVFDGTAKSVYVPMTVMDDGCGALTVDIVDFGKYGYSKAEALEKYNFEVVDFEEENTTAKDYTITFEVKIKQSDLESFDNMARSANIEVRKIS